MSKFAREHYEFIARVIKQAREREVKHGLSYIITVEDVTDIFVEELSRDNPKFDEQKFRKAAQ